MKSSGVIDRLVGYASGALVVLGAIAMLLMVAHVVIDVSGRYFFNHPLPATIETVSFYYMVMVTALPFAYVTRDQGQITVEMFTNWLSPRALHLLEAVVGVLVLAFVSVIAWKMIEEAGRMTSIGEVHDAGTMQLVTWPSRWFGAAGYAVMACAVLLRIIEDIKGFLRP